MPRQLLFEHVLALDSEWLSQLIARASWYFGDELGARENSLELAFCDEFLDRTEAKKVRAWIESGRRSKVITRTTALGLQLVNFALGPRHGPTDDAAIRGSIQALIKTNDNLDRDFEARGASVPATPTHDPLLAASFYRVGFYAHSPSFGPAFARFWAIMGPGLEQVSLDFPGDAFDFFKEFRDAFGVEVEELLALGLGLLSYYQALSKDRFNESPESFLIGPKFFSTLSNEVTKARAPTVLGYLSATWEEHSQRILKGTSSPPDNLQQFFGMYERPLVRVSEDVFYPLDLPYCYAQVTEGVYWRLLARLSEDGRKTDGNRLRTVFGRAFEWYANQIVEPLRAHGDSGVFVWSGAEIEKVKGASDPDFLVMEGDTLYVVEATVAAVPPSVSVSCDPDALLSALGNIWLGASGGSAKLTQLQSAWRAGLERRLKVKGLDWTRVKHVEPVFLCLRPIPQHPGILPTYRELLRECGIEEEFIRRLVFLSAEEWEGVCDLRQRGTTWNSLWQQKREPSNADLSMLSMLREKRLLTDVAPPVRRFLDDAMANMKTLLFPDQ